MSTESVSVVDLKPSPVQAEIAEEMAIHKTRRKPLKTFLLSMMSGSFIAIGFAFFVTVTSGAGAESSAGLIKLAGGFVFSLGLILVVVTGTDLFTSTVLSLIPKVDGKIGWGEMFFNWVIVYIGNFVGALFMAFLLWLASHEMYMGGQWGATVLSVASHKLEHTWIEAFALGILCNILVCMAVWLSYAGRTLTDKILALVLPITMFVASGFEHSVANMFMIPLGIIFQTSSPDAFWQAIGSTADKYDILTVSNFIFKNLIPVTLGNIVGGGILVGLGLSSAFLPKHKQ